MPERLFVQAKAGTSYPTDSVVSTAGLTSDFLEAASQRLGAAALLYAAAYFVAYGTGRLAHQLEESFHRSHLLVDVLAVISIAVSIVVYLLVRSRRFNPQFLLDIGLIYWVVGAVGIDLGGYYSLISAGIPVVGISWVCVWLVIFPAVVPNSPGKVLLAALVTASMGPLTFLIALVLADKPVPDQTSLVQVFVSYYICAGLAVVGSRIIYRLGREVTEAREMGSYKLVRLLGQGGMGEVWLARHKLLARPAAIKLLKPEVLGKRGTSSDSVLLKRFEREAKTTAGLHSPHTVQLYDFGVTNEGSFYYAMELLEGLDLEKLIERFGPIPASRAVYLLKQACNSLAEAHENDLVHRDIKPSNLYVSRLGHYCDFVKVLDFGLVKQNQDLGGDVTRLTAEGITTETPAYMAPETALGSKNIDASADLYSLGCVGYWLLTGRLVFEGQTAMELVLQHVQATPAAPSELTEIEIPGALESIILSCLEKAPEQRPGSARELGEQLAACQISQPWSNAEAEQWWKLHQPVKFESPPAESQPA